MNRILKSIIDKHRRDFERRCAGRSIPAEILDGIREERNIRYLEDEDPAHVMDRYCPNTVQPPTPVIIHIHGGGFVTGSKDASRHFCISLCKMGFIVFSVEYSHCPEATFFGQLEDIHAAMNCVERMMPSLRACPGYCFLTGDDAGAMLAVYAAAIQRNQQLAKATGIQPSGLDIRAMCLISGLFYPRRLGGIGLFLPKVIYGDYYRRLPVYPYLKPNNESVCMALPPCFLVTSRHDRLRSHSYHMTASILLQEVPCILYDYGDDPELTHAFPVLDPEHLESREVIEDITKFFTDRK